MTDDEAFVRRIVDSPGDDIPRLVYADWLDERGDPREAYLRAECEWAMAREVDREKQLRRLSSGLNAVWVARVSRPPVGVCLSTIRVKRNATEVTESDIDRNPLAQRIEFSSELRALLINYNGCEFTTGQIQSQDARRNYYECCGFLAVDGTRTLSPQEWERTPCLYSTRHGLIYGTRESVLENYIPFGYSPDDYFGHNFLLLNGASYKREFRRIYYYQPSSHSNDARVSTILARRKLIAPTLPAFLALLEQDKAEQDEFESKFFKREGGSR